jgi:ubiquinol-cytochrome c reductase cytochrome c1 subunit
MRKLLLLLVLFPLSFSVGAAEGKKSCGEIDCDPVRIDLGDKPSLQCGARIFVNYCLSCHSAGYMRYGRMAEDLNIPEEILEENLMFATDKPGDLMRTVMRQEDAKEWFGTAPPDLTLVTRWRSPEWVYTYMRGFFMHPESPAGWNNIVFANVAMPHVLHEWQGVQRPIFETRQEKVEVVEDGKTIERTVEVRDFKRFEIVEPGLKTVSEFNRDMRDLTNFLVYMGEPAKLVRYSVGIYVLIFLAVFFVVAYLLKKEYWKDVH